MYTFIIQKLETSNILFSKTLKQEDEIENIFISEILYYYFLKFIK